jgi:phosphate acetyltransferase
VARSIYLASLEPRAGRSLVTLGLLELLSRRIGDVGYFRPVVRSGPGTDPRTDLVQQRFGVENDSSELFAFTSDEVAHLLAEGDSDEVFKTILERAKRLEQRHPFVVYDGTDYTGTAAALEFEFNAQVANHLGAPVLAVVNGNDRSPEDVIDALRIARESLLAEGCTLAATIVNRVHPAHLDVVRDLLDRSLHGEPVWAIPEEPLLGMPTVQEIADALDVRFLNPEPVDLSREVTSIKIAAMSLPNVLDHVQEGALLMVPGDRPDVVVGALASRLSTSYPNMAAMVITGGLDLHPNITKLLDGLAGIPVPMLAVGTDTYTTAQLVMSVPAVIRPDTERKIATALGLFEEHVDTAARGAVEIARSDRVTPLMFEYELLQRARADRRHIVLPEGTDDRILRASEILHRRNVVDLTLLGRRGGPCASGGLGVDIDDIPVIDPDTRSGGTGSPRPTTSCASTRASPPSSPRRRCTTSATSGR